MKPLQDLKFETDENGNAKPGPLTRALSESVKRRLEPAVLPPLTDKQRGDRVAVERLGLPVFSLLDTLRKSGMSDAAIGDALASLRQHRLFLPASAAQLEQLKNWPQTIAAIEAEVKANPELGTLTQKTSQAAAIGKSFAAKFTAGL